MKLRTKYFMILLVASLVPVAAVAVISHRASVRLGHTISTEVCGELVTSVRREIVFAAENYAMITRQSKSAIEFALQTLKGHIDIALHQPVSSGAYSELYFAEDFEKSSTAPKDLSPSKLHRRILTDGSLQSKSISLAHPNFLLAPGVAMKEVSQDIGQLSFLAPAMKRIASELGDSLFWIYASLESGVHISYPGHGGYPPDYDPRQRPWYERAKKLGQLTWGDPIVDITTHQLTFTVSCPFYREDGSFAGVAAIDVLIPKVLLKHQISSQWTANMQSFLIGHADETKENAEKVWILSQKEPGETPGDYMPDNWISQEEHSDILNLVPYLRGKNSGSLERPYKGVVSLWAFARIFPGFHFVIVAPKSSLTGLSKEVGSRFADYTDGQIAISLAAITIVIFVVSGIAFFISRIHTRKIVAIVNGFKRLEKGDYSVHLNLNFSDERDMIVIAFNSIIPRLEEHLRMSRALGLAKDVQQSLLPNQNPVFNGYDIAGNSLYCEEIGGDYYDFIPIRDDRLAVVVGDVSGHGVSSSLLMATARALIMLRASMPGPAANIINDVNRHLSLDTYDTGNFMTFFYCELTSPGRVVHWVRAGHDPALLYDEKTDRFDELRGHGPAFGLDESFEYEAFQRRLHPGQVILIGTDGIWEMRDDEERMFGKQRLMDIIRENAGETADHILTEVFENLKNFRGERQPEDDVTMVVIKVLPLS